MIVKLGTDFFVLGSATVPLLRMNAVRRLTSPWAGSTTNVATNHSPSGNMESGPRSTLCCFWPRNPGRTAKPATGTVMRPPITPPRPSVAPSRKRLRVTVVSATGAGMTSCWPVGDALNSRRSGSTTIGSPRSSAVASRAQRKPKTIAIAPPIDEISSGLITRPTRTTTIPIAKPMGHSVGDGRCASSWSDSCSVSGLGCSGSTKSKSYRKRLCCVRRTSPGRIPSSGV